MEAAYLRPATERKQQETEKLRAINEMLRNVIRRKENTSTLSSRTSKE